MGKTLAVLIIIVIGICVTGCLLSRNHDKSEHMTLTPNVTNDIRYLPYYYYTLPFRYEQGGAVGPGEYTRMSHWQPGYDVHGRSFGMRPGMSYDKWRSGVWAKQNGSYYFINNGGLKDRVADYYGVS